MKKTIYTILIILLPTLLFAQWAKNIGSTGNDFGRNITVDGSGNSYITGWFRETVDFDPGGGNL